MTKRETRLFAIVGTGLAALAFLIMTVDSHRQFPKLTNSENITPEVIHGMDVWHKYNCINCHTLFGEGAYFAPDLTKITKMRGEQYLIAYMKNPENFYDEETHRRLMPNQNLEEKEIVDLIQFLDWVANVDNQGWPPRPILVTGAAIPGTDLTVEQQQDSSISQIPPGARTVTDAQSPIAQGERVFRTAIPSCSACHSIAPGVNMAGPTLAGIGTRADQVVASGDYAGEATDGAGFIRESIVAPSAHVTPGAMYSAGGVSFMPATYAESLTPEEIEQLVAYLGTLR